MNKQECIPVGCVPSATVAAGEGVVSAPGGVWETGGCLPDGCLPSGGGGLPRGVFARGGEGCLPQCMLGYTPSCEQND